MSTGIKEIHSDALKQVVKSSGQPLLVEIWAPWCTACASLNPVLETLAAERDGILIVAKLDASTDPKFAASLGVRGLPTLLLYRGGELIASRQGAAPRSIIARFIDEALAT